MITVLAHSLDTPQTITLPLIITNSLLLACLILGIFGVMGFQRCSPIAIFQLQLSHFPRSAGRGLLWLLITYPLIIVTQVVVQQFSGSRDDSQLIVRYFLEHPDLRYRLAVILMAVIVAPLGEEIIFRGYFYGVIRRFGGRIPALLISSLLFAAIHAHIPSIPGLFLLAMILCLLYERTGSLWAPIALHATFNASSIAALLLWPDKVS
jgi:membrane protease YdiL (CAAX protease family)